MVDRGEIVDAKTVLLLRSAQREAETREIRARAGLTQLMILVAGPVRGGTGDDPELIRRNIDEMTRIALDLYREATFRSSANGSLFRSSPPRARSASETTYTTYPASPRRTDPARCDGCLRSAAPPPGADHMVAIGPERWEPVGSPSTTSPPREPDTAQARV